MEKLSKKNVLTGLGLFIVPLIITCIMGSCKTSQVAHAKTTTFAPIYMVKTVVVQAKQDTPKRKQSTMSNDQVKALLRYNFETFYAKEFKSLTSTNSGLATMLQDMRERGIKRQLKLDSAQYTISMLRGALNKQEVSSTRMEAKMDSYEAKEDAFRKTAVTNETYNSALDTMAKYGLIALACMTILYYFLIDYKINRAFKKGAKSI